MKRHYRIAPEGRQSAPTDAEIARYRDPKRLLYNYQKASQLFHKKPLYRDPKAFFALLLIVALAWFLADVVDKRSDQVQKPGNRDRNVPSAPREP